jgi:CheY-like chemotaxis protein
LFPAFATSVEVVSVKPGVVRLGIEAPADVTVLRQEVLERNRTGFAEAPQANRVSPAGGAVIVPQLRNRLNTASVGLSLLRRQLRAGLTTGAEATLDEIDREFEALRQEVEEAAPKVLSRQSVLSRRALLVEDDRNERELLAGLLRMAGLNVDTAGDGADALEALRTRCKPDVVLLDMMLPRCDGPATVRAIRGDPELADIKIFAVTGHQPDYFPLAQDMRGIDRWFQKPINPEVLLQDLKQDLLVA